MRSAVYPDVRSIVRTLEHPDHQALTHGQRLGRWVTAYGGSLPSLLIHVIVIGSWIAINRGTVIAIRPFDPYPYGGLATGLAVETIVLTLLILMNQAAATRQADRRSHVDLQINLLAEQEATLTVALLRRVCERLGVAIDDLDRHHDIAKLSEKTDVEQIVEAVDEHL